MPISVPASGTREGGREGGNAFSTPKRRVVPVVPRFVPCGHPEVRARGSQRPSPQTGIQVSWPVAGLPFTSRSAVPEPPPHPGSSPGPTGTGAKLVPAPAALDLLGPLSPTETLGPALLPRPQK